MILNKNQIEAVRYQLKKLGVNGTNDDIRNCAANFKDFDAVLIAQQIAANKTNSLATNDNTNQSEESNFLALLDNEEITQSTTLTTTQKQELVKIKSVELGIELNESEIISIVDMVENQIQDSIDFLNEVGILISEFFSNRNKQAKDLVNSKVDSIKRIINAKNEELGDIFNGANQELINVTKDCIQQKTDYKSTYKRKLESIREILKLPA